MVSLRFRTKDASPGHLMPKLLYRLYRNSWTESLQKISQMILIEPSSEMLLNLPMPLLLIHDIALLPGYVILTHEYLHIVSCSPKKKNASAFAQHLWLAR